MRSAQEEVFGPVLSVIGFDTLDEAIAIANGTRYGLAAMVWSSNIDVILHASRHLVAGVIHVNGGSGPWWNCRMAVFANRARDVIVRCMRSTITST